MKFLLLRRMAWAIYGLFLAMPTQSADDLQADRQLAINQCHQCHTFDVGEPHGQGPNLFGLIGRKAAAVEGFRFSKGYEEAMAGKIWDTALLEQWLTDTLSVAPKTTMVYWQDDPNKRASLIRFLESLH